jgi:hypothetical protein
MPPRWAICLDVDHPGPWWTKYLMEKATFTRASLSDVRVIMAIMCVLVEELLCQAVTMWFLVLECMLSLAHGRLCLCPIISGIKDLFGCMPNLAHNAKTFFATLA